MAVINNTLNEIGDSFIVEAGFTTGIESIVGFTESIDGETPNRILRKEFMYCVDGIHWSDWKELDLPNLTSISINAVSDFGLRYRFTRIGTDDTGSITWHWINIETIQASMECGPYFNDSPYSFFFNCCCDEEILQWCVNVLRKMYEPGIVSKTLIRGQNANENDEDRDYIDFWRSISCMYALMVAYGRKFESFDSNQILLEKYLEMRDLGLHNDNDMDDLQSLMKNYHKEIGKRGTIRGEHEIKRLISYNPVKDQYLSSTNVTGWVLDQTSPLYREILDNGLFNVRYDESHPLLNSGNVTIGDETEILVTTGQKTGYGMAVPTWSSGFNVDSSIGYQLRFLAKTSDLSGKITVNIYGWDAAGNSLNPLTVNIGSSSNKPIDKVQLIKEDEFYEFRILIYPYTSPFSNDDNYIKCFGGYNMKLVSQISRIFTEITLDDTGSDCVGALTLKDIQFSMANTPYGKGYVGCQSMREMFFKNNSGRQNDEDISMTIQLKHLHYKNGGLNTFTK